MNNQTGLRILAAVVLVLAIGGIAFFAYQAGIANGSPVTIEAPSGQVAPAPYPYYGYGMPFHLFGSGFGCFGFLFLLFLAFLALKAFRVLFWGPRWGHHHGHWGARGVPPMFNEWHKQAHGESTEEKKE
jgi:hypothetical protein